MKKTILAALLCLADELDIAAGRNVSFLYDVDRMPSPRDRREFRKHMAIHQVELEPEQVVIRAWTEDPEIWAGVEEVSFFCLPAASAETPASEQTSAAASTTAIMRFFFIR